MSILYRFYKVVCGDCGEVLFRNNLAKHARETHHGPPRLLRVGDRPGAPKYVNWRAICKDPENTEKVERQPLDPASPSKSELELEEQVTDNCTPIPSQTSTKDLITGARYRSLTGADDTITELSDHTFIQRDKIQRSDISTPSRLSRRIGRRERVLMKPVKMIPLLYQVQSRFLRMKRVKIGQRRRIFWLKKRL